MLTVLCLVLCAPALVSAGEPHLMGPEQRAAPRLRGPHVKDQLDHAATTDPGPYQPTWASLDARPLPAWYDAAKVGVFIHWGVFSVPAIDGGWFWQYWRGNHDPYHVRFMKRNFRPGFTYQEFAPRLTAQLWKPQQWADLLQRSGARYVVLTAKHHEGFTLWPSPTAWSWNALDVGPHRDLVGELAAAVRNRTDLRFGLYHSLYEWYNPLYLSDRANNRSDFVTRKTMPELFDLVHKYQPEVIWSDGDWNDSPEYWRSREFLAWLYNSSPVRDTVVTNDRWGRGTVCHHGGYLTCSDKYNPGVLQTRKWENAFTLDLQAWGFDRRSGARDYMTIERLLATLVQTVSCGGNVLINVGPTADGTIAPIMEERLTQLGQWLAINGEAIYESRPWRLQNDTLAAGVWYTQRAGTLYASLLRWPADGRLHLGVVRRLGGVDCRLLGFGPVQCEGSTVALPPLQKVGSEWAWVLELGPVANQEPSGAGQKRGDGWVES